MSCRCLTLFCGGPRLPVVYRRKVGRDLAGYFSWYNEQRDGLGDEFLAAVDSVFDTIEQYPEIFTLMHGEIRRAVLSRFPFAVFYRVESKRVVVLTVLHTARDPKGLATASTGRALTICCKGHDKAGVMFFATVRGAPLNRNVGWAGQLQLNRYHRRNKQPKQVKRGYPTESLVRTITSA